MSNLNEALCASLLASMSDHGVSMRAVARLLDRSPSYVSGRLTGVHALSVDIVSAVAQLAHMSDRALMAEIMSRVAGTGQGSSDS